MRHEPAQIAGDASRIFANTQSASLVVDDPDTEHRMVPAEIGQCCRGLINVPFSAVISRRFLNHCAAFDPEDVAALAAQLGLAHVRASQRFGCFIGGQKIRMAGKQFPKHGQQTLVAQQHFPRWLDELDSFLGQDEHRTAPATAIPTDTT